jgi:hypothetical protein
MMQTTSPTTVISLLMWAIVPAPLAQVQLAMVVQLAEVSNIFLIP